MSDPINEPTACEVDQLRATITGVFLRRVADAIVDVRTRLDPYDSSRFPWQACVDVRGRGGDRFASARGTTEAAALRRLAVTIGLDESGRYSAESGLRATIKQVKRTLDDSRAENARLREIVDALPRCGWEGCDAYAMQGIDGWRYLACDDCVRRHPERYAEATCYASLRVSDLPYAEALRTLTETR